MEHSLIILKRLKEWIYPVYFCIAVISCANDNLQTKKIQICESRGTITGPDLRLCPSPCCGGWDITIENKNYSFSELPKNSGIDLEKVKFPLKVRLDWKLDSLGCNHIDILRIALDEFKSEGTIIGYDARLCACCGGLEINIADTVYLINKWPDNSCVDLPEEHFPLKVQLDWSADTASACRRIIVTSVAKVD